MSNLGTMQDSSRTPPPAEPDRAAPPVSGRVYGSLPATRRRPPRPGAAERPAGLVCPYYQAASTNGTRGGGAARCAATPLRSLIPDSRERAFCLTADHPRCPLFQAIRQPVAAPAPEPVTDDSLGRSLLVSAAWVVGIPLALVLIILIAALLTEGGFHVVKGSGGFIPPTPIGLARHQPTLPPLTDLAAAAWLAPAPGAGR